jgi:predicted GNAT family acetyltransferase
MTDQQQTLQGVIITTHGDTVACRSIDLVAHGVLYVDPDGDVSLMPWHAIARVAFFDKSSETIHIDEPYVPERHEGSE